MEAMGAVHVTGPMEEVRQDLIKLDYLMGKIARAALEQNPQGIPHESERMAKMKKSGKGSNSGKGNGGKGNNGGKKGGKC